MIVLVHGPDAATTRTELAKLLTAHDPDGVSTTRLDGRSVAIGQAAAMVGTVGFLGQSRVIVIDDLMARAANNSTRSDGQADADAPAAGKLDLAPLLGSVAPGNVLILVDVSLSSIPTAIRKACPPETRIIAGDPPRGRPLLEWMQRTARESASELSMGLARELAELTFPQTWAAKPSNPRYDHPPVLDMLRNEIEKLALAAHPGSIEHHHIQDLTTAASADRLFPFLEAAVAGDLTRGVTELGRLRDAGEDGHRLTAQMHQQIELAAVQETAGALTDPVEVGRAIGLPNPNRMIGIARARRTQSAAESVQMARLVDRAAKTGHLRDPMDVLFDLIANLAGPPASRTQRRSG